MQQYYLKYLIIILAFITNDCILVKISVKIEFGKYKKSNQKFDWKNYNQSWPSRKKLMKTSILSKYKTLSHWKAINLSKKLYYVHDTLIHDF